MSDMLPPGNVERPSTPAAPTVPKPPVEPARKPPVLLGFAVLGFVVPWVLNLVPVLLAYVALALDPSGAVLPVFGACSSLLPQLTLAGIVLAFVLGRARGDNRLRSFGIGGLASVAVAALLALLAFGTCLLAFP